MQHFSNLLRTKFLKSFEEKMKEIESARNKELTDLSTRHRLEMDQLINKIMAMHTTSSNG